MDLSFLKNEQDKRNFIRNSDENLFVEAGPGAGKTTFISRRIINQIKKGISPDNFVFIAFTKEAAQEIRDKIKKNIKRDLVKAEDEEEAVLAKALVNLPNMCIMTIADLCKRILDKAGYNLEVYTLEEGNAGIDISNRQLLVDTMECLRTRGDFLKDLKKIYTHIYVDEYQDTNELQTAILWMLATDDTGEKLRDNSLFLVGDDKQSIYLREGADVSVFKRIRERMRNMANAGVITLYENYRSEEHIIDFINDRFSKLFDDYSLAKKDWTIKSDESFHGVWRVAKPEVNYSAKTDIDYTLKTVKTLVLDEKKTLEDKNSGDIRRINYSDFLVIINSDDDVSIYYERANELGIDTSVNGISIMSLHSVKGLSGNIVVIANRSNTANEYFGSEEITKEQREEWTRYEYVALTRARHAIVFMPEIVKNCKFSEENYRLEQLPVLKV